jgi:hypothetical protein
MWVEGMTREQAAFVQTRCRRKAHGSVTASIVPSLLAGEARAVGGEQTSSRTPRQPMGGSLRALSRNIAFNRSSAVMRSVRQSASLHDVVIRLGMGTRRGGEALQIFNFSREVSSQHHEEKATVIKAIDCK